jgi:hypothetical protein
MIKKYGFQIGVLLFILLNSLKNSYNEKSNEDCPLPDFINKEMNSFDSLAGTLYKINFTKFNFVDPNGLDSIVGDYYLATIGSKFVYLMTKNIGEKQKPEIIPFFINFFTENKFTLAASTLFSHYDQKYNSSRKGDNGTKIKARIKFSYEMIDSANRIFHVVHKNEFNDERHYLFNLRKGTIEFWYVKDKDSPEDYDRSIYWY